MNARVLIAAALLFAAGCKCSSKVKPPAPPPTGDRALFQKAGIDAPVTLASNPDTGEVDLAAVRAAISEPKEVSEADLWAMRGPGVLQGLSGALPPDVLAQGSAPAAPASPLAEARVEGDSMAARMPAPEPSPGVVGIGDLGTSGGGQVHLDSAPRERQLQQKRFNTIQVIRGSGGGSGADPKAEPEKPSVALPDAKAPATVLPKVQTAARMPKILVQDEEGAYQPLAPRAMRVVTYLEGPRARTVVDCLFENRFDRRLEGTFYYPLPGGAAVAAFATYAGSVRAGDEALFQSKDLLPALGEAGPDVSALGVSAPPSKPGARFAWGERQEARVVEQKRAREVYEQVVRQNVDPALLEWAGSSNFSARVFPLEAHSLKRVVVAYEQTLLFDGKLLRYSYPLDPAGRLPIDARVHVRGPKDAVVSIGPGTPAPHPAGSWTAYDFSRLTGEGSLEVALKPDGPDADVLAGEDPGGLPGKAFFARVRLPGHLTAGKQAAPTGRAVLVVDTSLTGEDANAYALQAATLRAILETDETLTEYAVLLFDVKPRWLHGPGFRKNEPASRAQTFDELSRVYLEGATNFDAVLSDLDSQAKEWLRPAEGAGKVHAFLLSDGQITWGQDKVEALLARHPSTQGLRWISYRFGESAVNGPLVDGLSRVS
ncbi:MAG: hypothetical protein ACYC8T_10290, partial [Myxococcaceae bacterium]